MSELVDRPAPVAGRATDPSEPVAVIGNGPVGQTAALLLARWEPFVGGAWGGRGPTYERRDPGDTSRVVGLVRHAGPEQVEQAYAAATAAMQTWGRLDAAERAAVLYRAADILDADAGPAGRDLVREEGKTLREAHIPFGGIKASGFGPLEQGDTTAEFFTHTRVLNLHPHGPLSGSVQR